MTRRGQIDRVPNGSQPAARIRRQRTPAEPKEQDRQIGAKMACGAGYSRALILGASVFSMALSFSDAGLAQTADTPAADGSSEPQKQAKRKPAKPKPVQQAAAPVMNARAQA